MLRKFDDPHRTVIIYTTLLAPAGTDLLFRETCWLIASASRSTSDLLPAHSVLQTCYQLHAETKDSNGVTPTARDHAADLSNFLQHTQSEKMRAYHLQVQSMLLHEFNAQHPSFILETRPHLMLELPSVC